MSNQQNQKPTPNQPQRGNTAEFQAIDDSGFAPQGSVKVETPEGTQLSQTDFGAEPVEVKPIVAEDAPQEEQPVLVAVEEQPVVESEVVVGFNGEEVDPAQVDAQVDDSFKEPTEESDENEITEELDDSSTAEDDIIAGVEDQIIQMQQGLCEEYKAVSSSYPATPALVGFALRLASLGIIVKNVDGTIDDLNSTQIKGFRDITQVSHLLWTAKIPSGGFGDMTGSQYMRSLNHVLDAVAKSCVFTAQLLICPSDKSLDSIEDISKEYEDGNLITLQDAIEQGIKISKHHIFIIISGTGSNRFLGLQTTCDQNVEGFYFLQNTLEVITPGLLAMTRYIAKLASTGKFALHIDESAGFYIAAEPHYLPFSSEDGEVLGEQEILEVFENFSFQVMETEHKLADSINAIITPSRILELLNTVTDEVDIERYSKVSVTTQEQYDSFFTHVGAKIHKVNISLAQSWDIDVSSFDEEDDQEEDE